MASPLDCLICIACDRRPGIDGPRWHHPQVDGHCFDGDRSRSFDNLKPEEQVTALLKRQQAKHPIILDVFESPRDTDVGWLPPGAGLPPPHAASNTRHAAKNLFRQLARWWAMRARLPVKRRHSKGSYERIIVTRSLLARTRWLALAAVSPSRTPRPPPLTSLGISYTLCCKVPGVAGGERG